ncbi:amino acid adenylation domain-containing protein, partial [Herbivorax sp. ANBcel31]|uniref:amino acid adenylation domain-containing protein n=1 Tax=Herbivorax sp. ANBcel31 TaxID=3069754 RepID=UPI0027AE96EC
MSNKNEKNKLNVCDNLMQDEVMLINSFNDTDISIENNKTLHKLFEEQVEKTPENIAVIFENEKITYRELNEKSNQISNFLLEQGIKRGDLIGLIAKRNIKTIVNMLGILKAGGIYVPIEPEYPEERKKYILNNSNCKIVLDADEILEQKILKYSVHAVKSDVSSKDLAYVIYTSGSTGNPKGVMITHQAVVNTILDINQKFNVNSNDRIIGLSSMCFDLSVYDIFGALSTGAALVQIQDQRDIGNLIKVISSNEITIWNSVPAIMDMLVESLEDCFINTKLRLVLLSGDWISLKLPDKVKKHFVSAELVSLGGATEASIWSIYYPIKEIKPEFNSIPYGMPLANQKFYVLTEELKLCPVGVKGELYIGGKGVAKGYINNLETTKKAFIKHPYFGDIYKTGDYGILHKEGYIEFLGRKDQQVKIRGYRIELAEIESKLNIHPNIKESVVLVHGKNLEQKQLCAYFTSDDELCSTNITQYLSNLLPEYMIPVHFIQLDEFPLTPNGKFDRKILEKLMDRSLINEEVVEEELVENPTQIKLQHLFKNILGIKKVSVYTSFFNMGGDSLKASMLVYRIEKEFNIQSTLNNIFTLKNIVEISKYIESSTKKDYIEIESVNESEYYKLSSQQKRQYILHQQEEIGTTYNICAAYDLEGDVDVERLDIAIKKLINRHEALRTSFGEVNGEPIQRVNKEVDFKIEYSQIKEEEISKTLFEFIKPFDLSKAPLIRVGLYKIHDNRNVIILDMHHIISDGVSLGVIFREISELYEGKDLPKPRVQYKDYAKWHNELLDSQILKIQEKYWINKFSGELPTLDLQTDYSKYIEKSFEGDKISLILENKLVTKLKSLATQTETTLYMLLFSAYNILLSKYAGQEEIIVGTFTSGRTREEVENLIGMFVNTLPIRSFPNESKSFIEFLKEVKENELKAYENQEYQFENLISKLNIETEKNRNPLFNVAFVFQNEDLGNILIKNVKATPIELNKKTTTFDITMEVVETDTLRVNVEYCTKLFKKETVERLAEHYINILDIISKKPDEKIADIQILSDNEKDRMLDEFNDPKAEYPKAEYPKDKTIQELFEDQVEKNPDNIAVVYEEQKVTYRELNIRSNQLAR